MVVRGFPVELDGFLTGDVTGVLDLNINGDKFLLASEDGVLGWGEVDDGLFEGGVA